MFQECLQLKEITINSPYFGKNATDFSYFCSNNKSLKKINLEQTSIGAKIPDPSKGEKSSYVEMFSGCKQLATLDISKFVAIADKSSPENSTDAQNMLRDCDLLFSVTIGEGWTKDIHFGRGDINPNLPGEGWSIDGSSVSQYEIPTKYGPGTYVRAMPKAVYDQAAGTLTFTIDNEIPKDGTTVYSINKDTGILPYPIFPDWYDVTIYKNGKRFVPPSKDSKRSEDNRADDANDSLDFSKDEVSVDIRNKVPNAKKVIFNDSFKGMNDLYSMAFWFVGDSYGVHPYESFSGFKNINTQNMDKDDAVCCMFGGLNLGIAYEYTAFQNKMMSGADFTYVLESNIHANDTYGSSNMHTEGKDYLDLSEFDSELYGGVHLTNYMGMFTNATGLTKVFFNRTLGQAEQFKEGNVPLTYSYMFMGCENLKEVQNFEYAINQTKNQSLCVHMFDGCRNLEKIDLSSFSAMNILDLGADISGRGLQGFYNMFNDCTRLNSVTVGTS